LDTIDLVVVAIPPSILHELQFRPWFWRRRQDLQRRLFQFRALRFKGQSSAQKLRSTLSIFGQLFSIIIWRMVAAIILVSAFIFVERFLNIWLAIALPLSAEAQLSYLSTLGQVSAAFLALYFTALSVVVSTAYSRVPGDIRGLIMREEVGSFYFKVLAQFAAVVTVMLAALVLKFSVGPLNMLFVTLLCLFSIFCFAVLGVRAFEYFDPASLLPYVGRDLQRAIELVVAGSQHWKDQSFQAHHQRQAQELANSYGNLVTLGVQSKNPDGAGLKEIGAHLVAVLRFYCERKYQIPSSSYWFARTYKHKDWLLSSYTEVGIALATATALQPEAVPDHLWLEKHLAPILRRALLGLSAVNDRTGMIAALMQLHNTANTLGRVFAIEEAFEILRAVRDPLTEQWNQITDTAAPNDRNATQERMALIDVYTSSAINLLLGYAKGFATLAADHLQSIFVTIKPSRPQSIYLSGILPRRATQELESIQAATGFESKVFARPISPEWFRIEMFARSLTIFLDETCKQFLSEFADIFERDAEEHLAKKRYATAALVATKGLEGCTKLGNTFRQLSDLHKSYQTLNRSKEFEWPTIDWSNLAHKASRLRDRLIVLLAKCVGELGKTDSPDDLPDFFGEAYAFVADGCFNAALVGDEPLFKELFPRFFDAVLKATDRLRRRFATDSRRAAMMIDPLADLAAVSGYALVLSDLHQIAIGSTVQTCWDVYFNGLPTDEARRAIINLLAFVVAPTMFSAPRDMLRYRWKGACRDLLRDRRLLVDHWDRDRRFRSVKHPSALVRAFADQLDLLTDGEDVFLSAYVFPRPESSTVEKPTRVESFERALQREQTAVSNNESVPD
jgi:hypothetical protein